MVTVATPPGTSREKTEKVLKDVADVAKAQDGVEQVMSISGLQPHGGRRLELRLDVHQHEALR